MTTRVAIVSQKGGVGKTTVALNLALALAERGQRVLLADLDPQGGVGHALARSDGGLVGLADIVAGRIAPAAGVLPTKQPNLSLLPRGRLAPIEVCDYEQALFRPGVLERIFAASEGGFELVVLDTPSGMGMATRAALRVADHALLALQAEPAAFRTIGQALQVIEHVRAVENPRLGLLGILATMVDKSKDPSMGVLIDAWSELAGVLETTIPRADVFAEASQIGLPLGYLAGPPSPEARRFELLAGEVESLIVQAAGAAAIAHVQRELL
ncbi:MAG: ParA family protein [Deltaproteobacteria bacterium]|nr:ParA family protein [Deltaproteobacteria bacterium]